MTTRALRTAVRVVVRVVVPVPLSFWSPDWLRRFARAPLAALGPARAVMEALALDARSVVLAPVAAALMVSVTTIVTTSSTRLARRSRAI